MKKSAIAITLIVLFGANVAFAGVLRTTDAPASSVDTCIAQVAAQADYAGAGSVTHEVETEERRVSGHKMKIATLVYGEGEVIREYASFCAINDNDEIKRFNIRQKGI